LQHTLSMRAMFTPPAQTAPARSHGAPARRICQPHKYGLARTEFKTADGEAEHYSLPAREPFQGRARWRCVGDNRSVSALMQHKQCTAAGRRTWITRSILFASVRLWGVGGPSQTPSNCARCRPLLTRSCRSGAPLTFITDRIQGSHLGASPNSKLCAMIIPAQIFRLPEQGE
jgi:hypothetical protein